MKSVLIFAYLFCSVMGRKTTWKELKNYSFEKFVAEFKHEFGAVGGDEWNKRKSLFETELARVVKHNDGNFSWKEGVNKFSALSSSEKKALYGRNKNIAFNHKPKHQMPFDLKLKPLTELPTQVDWREAGVVSPVKDQGKIIYLSEPNRNTY